MSKDPEPYVDPTNEYSKILKQLQTDEITKDDAYSKLMEKEDNVLKVVDRVARNEQRQTDQQSLFYNLPLIAIVALFANTWKNIFIELVVHQKYQSPDELIEVFFAKDRKIYVGIMVLFIALFLYIIDVL